MYKKTNSILISILIILILSLFAAFFIEYQLGHKPCKLCIYQRIPYIISILIIMNFVFMKKYQKISLLFLSLISLVGAILSFYHFGIEQGFFSESFVCEAKNIQGNLTKEDILQQLKNNTVSCKEVTFTIFGASLASLNTIFSFVLFCKFVSLYKNYEINK